MAASLEILEKRARIIQAIREFFTAENFLEVETPILVASPGMEPHLEAFETEFVPEGYPDCHGIPVHRYLPTSPEFHMKRLLARGCQRIFQLARAFRNGELGQTHEPEFTILEWYRSNSGYEAIMDDTEKLFHFAARRACGKTSVQRQGQVIDLTPPWERLTVHEAWQKYAGIDLANSYTENELREVGRGLNVPHLLDGDSLDVIYFKIFLHLIEPQLGINKPTILYEYPSDQAALARIKPDNPAVALRFEVYAGGLELGNAFDELTSASIQLERCQEARTIQKTAGKTPFPVDDHFIKALRAGIPPSAGIAVGVDRLVMLLLELDSIGDCVAFPFSQEIS